MNSFTDKHGRLWLLSLTLGDIRRIRVECGVDVGELLKNPTKFAESLDDPEKFGALLWCLCSEEATARGVTPEQFAFGLDGSAVQSAYLGVVGAVADFYQSPEMARTLKARIKSLVEKTDVKNANALSKKLDSALQV